MILRRHRIPSHLKRQKSFVLLEVIVSITILAISMVGILRGFMIALSTVRENRVAEQAALLAESLMMDYEIVPPSRGKADGSFADDDRFGEAFEHFYWERDVDEDEFDYRDRGGLSAKKFEPVYDMELKIIYDDGNYRRFEAITIQTRLVDLQLFNDRTIQSNQMF